MACFFVVKRCLPWKFQISALSRNEDVARSERRPIRLVAVGTHVKDLRILTLPVALQRVPTAQPISKTRTPCFHATALKLAVTSDFIQVMKAHILCGVQGEKSSNEAIQRYKI